MKIDALDHPKTLDLAERLGVCLPQAIGHLELFWNFVAQKTARGNVGRWSDGAIARSAQWDGDSAMFVRELESAGFIDPSPEHRYLVHDWPEHCPNWVRSKLKRSGKSFFIPELTSELSPAISGDYKPSQGTGGQAKPDARVKRATQISERFQPDKTCQQKAASLGLDLDAELEKFRNHAQSKGRTVKDWQAAFRNWLIKSGEYHPNGPGNHSEDIWAGTI